MGIVSYYRNFVPNLATLAEPLTRLTRKRIRVEWGWETQEAMEKLQDAISLAQALTVWDESLPTRVTTDASDVGMGAILEQKHIGDMWRIVASWSRKLTPCQQRYSTTDREWLAVVECVTRVWRHWLLGRDFEVRTDHAALKEMLTKKGEEFTHRQLRWYERLEPYSFTVTYIKEQENYVPDALSRTPAFYEVGAIEVTPEGPRHVLCVPEILQAAEDDKRYQALVGDMLKQREVGVVLTRLGLLETLDGRLCVPNDESLRFKIVLEAHEPLFAGHFSVQKTLQHVKRYWWWPRMNDIVERVVLYCPICQCDATKKKKDEGPLRPIVAGAPWEVVTIDFVSGFAPSLRGAIHYMLCRL